MADTAAGTRSAWDEACARFVKGLPEAEKKLFETATPENVFRDASAAHRQHLADSKFVAVQQKLRPLLDSVEDYGKALDVLSNASSLVLCPLWGSLRVLIHIAQAYGTYFDKLADMFARIGDVLPRFRVYEFLFPNHERLRLALSDAYLDIIRFCIDAKNVFTKAAKTLSLSRSISFKILWKPLKSRFDEYLSQFRRHRENVEKEAGLSHMLEARQAWDLQRTHRALQQRNAEAETKDKLLSCLSSLAYRKQHRKFQIARKPGTAAWITKTAKFRSWMQDKIEPCFWCTGIPGAGKTIIASSVVDTLALQCASPGQVCCYYYCDYADVATLEISTVYGSLIHQLLTCWENPANTVMDRLRAITESGKTTPSKEDLRELFMLCLAQPYWKTLFFVLDGIDELPRDGQTAILQMAHKIGTILKHRAKIFICSRHEGPAVLRAIESLNSDHHYEISLADVGDDVASYTRMLVDSKIKEGEMRFQNAQVRDEIIHSLINGAKDMFLWVKFQVDEICEAVNDEDIRSLLAHLPTDLAETYHRILLKLFGAKRGKTNLDIAEKAFRWLLYARRHLTLDELVEAVSIDLQDVCLEPTKLFDGRHLLGICGSLVHFDKMDQTVTFAHHTVKQYILSQPDVSPNQSASAGLIRFNLTDAGLHIGKLCLTYLSFSDFETQIVRVQARPNIGSKDMSQLVWTQIPHGHKLGAMTSYLSKLPNSRLGQLLSPNDRKVQLWAGPQPDRDDALIHKYALMNYIAQEWVYHIEGLSEDDNFWSQAVNLAFTKKLAFHHRPWMPSSRSQSVDGSDGVPDLVSWAMEQCIPIPFRLLKAFIGVSKLTSLLNSTHPSGFKGFLGDLIHRNQDDLVKIFLDWSPELDVILACVRPSLAEESRVPLFNHVKGLVFDLLKDASKPEIDHAVVIYEWALEQCLEEGDASKIERLIRCIVQFTGMACSWNRANHEIVHLREKLQDSAGLRHLVGGELTVKTFDMEGLRPLPAPPSNKLFVDLPLFHFASTGELGVVLRLLAVGANPNWNDGGLTLKGGKSALHQAIEADDIVMLWALLNHRRSPIPITLCWTDNGETPLHLAMQRSEKSSSMTVAKLACRYLVDSANLDNLLLCDKNGNIVADAISTGQDIHIIEHMISCCYRLHWGYGELGHQRCSLILKTAMRRGEDNILSLVLQWLGTRVTWDMIIEILPEATHSGNGDLVHMLAQHASQYIVSRDQHLALTLLSEAALGIEASTTKVMLRPAWLEIHLSSWSSTLSSFDPQHPEFMLQQAWNLQQEALREASWEAAKDELASEPTTSGNNFTNRRVSFSVVGSSLSPNYTENKTRFFRRGKWLRRPDSDYGTPAPIRSDPLTEPWRPLANGAARYPPTASRMVNPLHRS